MRSASAFAVGIALLFSGCAAGEGAADPLSCVGAVADDTGALRGRAIDDSINAVPNAVVAINGTEISTVTGPDGGYILGNLAPGTYVVVATLDGFVAAEAQVDIVAGEVAEHDFTLVPLASEDIYHVTQI